MQNFERDRILAKADGFLDAEVRTVTADSDPRSAGGKNDFFSQGDYWWPVEGKPDAPYEVRDGISNPDNFVAHRNSMMRLSEIVGTLATAHKMTGDTKYAEAANKHLKAWFVTPETAMTPHLLYGQAIIGRVTGRSIGIIDTMHLVDVAQGAKQIVEAGEMPAEDAAAVKEWFAAYSKWMNEHPYGIEERDWYNNHSIAWSMQIASFASLTGDETLMDITRDKFKNVYLSEMMADDGSFPKETARTKPYSYSIFVYDLMAGVAQLASTEAEDLWQYESPNGHSMKDGIEFITPYIEDKDSWPFPPDIQYWDEPNQRRAFLLFGSLAFDDCRYFELAKTLDPDPETYEVVRNMPIRSPLLWTD
ncbi:alginate lyase family protein [Litorimonas sp. RW-G-Af-16]|uniref:alginate lyase family protein n=1 Tax=Litorimonas sp. RW-G-Af-16 TaxID=3241168 RepID=UPI00390CAA0A